MPGKITKVAGTSEISPTQLKTFDVRGRNWDMVLFQPKRPVAEAELNVSQQIASQRLRRLARGVVGNDSAVLTSYRFDAVRITPNLGAGTASVLIRPNTAFLVNGELVELHLLDGMTVVNSGSNAGATITLPLPPVYAAWDEVGTEPELSLILEARYVEVQTEESLGTADTAVPEGGWDGATNDLGNDLHISDIPLKETTRRVQLRVSFRLVDGHDPEDWEAITSGSGYNYAVEGSSSSQPFRDGLILPAGDGSDTAASVLGSVDGYAYVCPVWNFGGAADLNEGPHVVHDMATLDFYARRLDRNVNRVFAGSVYKNTSGSTLFGFKPAGWTLTKEGTGQYLIESPSILDLNIGTPGIGVDDTIIPNAAIVGSLMGTGEGSIVFERVSSTSFRVRTFGSAGAQDRDFMFTVHAG